MKVNIVTTIALISSMAGSLLVAQKNVLGFWIWLVANTLWFIDSVNRKDWKQSLLWSYYNVTCVIGILTWM